MAQEDWVSAARNSWIGKINRQPYNTLPPSYRQYPNALTTRPAQAPPINQALTENFQPQYVQATDYNGQPVIAPASYGKQVRNAFRNFAENRAMDVAPLVGLATGGVTGLGLARYGMAQPTIANALAGVAAMKYGKPLIDGIQKIVYNPVTDKIENGVKTFRRCINKRLSKVWK